MGRYLNPSSVIAQFSKILNNPYFVDKSMLVADLIPFINTSNSYICITRPRRFGKSLAAQMVASFFEKTESIDIFKKLNISTHKKFNEHLNEHNVIFVDFSQDANENDTYQTFIQRKIDGIKKDLITNFPALNIPHDSLLSEFFSECFDMFGAKFIFVFDEWDSVFNFPFINDSDKNNYVHFLKDLLKDRAYVELAYMTGVMPIIKYSSGSDLNMFVDYTMLRENKFDTYFGFTDAEIDQLFQKYQKETTEKQNVTREKLRFWYDGYLTNSGAHIYNPRSVNLALSNNNIASYWTSSGPYDEVLSLLKKNVAEIQKPVSLMLSGESANCLLNEYSATSQDLTTKDQIFSAMVVYGLLTSCGENKVKIPNYEILLQFESILRQGKELGYIYNLAKKSEEMLDATLHFDTEKMAEILQYVHNTETPIFSYNNENELAAVVNLVYLAANDRYFVSREDKSGKGFTDFIFTPKNFSDDCIILELKVNSTPEEAINQIIAKDYLLRFKGKLGEKPVFTGKILAAGISYNKETKEHSCLVKELK